MSIRARRYKGRGTVRTILTACPCGYVFDTGEPRHRHIAEHDPEDFGLSPAGEIPADHAEPLFGGVGDGA